MHAIIASLILPPEISPFEARYLAKTNRIALAFFALHLPAFVLIAWLNQTGPGLAAGLTAAVLAGPALAYFTLKNPRTISVLYGATSMAMGALLVHFGQGPVQIEMHFYFFALIAMLALFGNPMVILTAAGTVAAHHLALWLLLPKSVFNYDAPVWVVAVHASFVVLESVGAIYIARSFFDNVIGLENIVRARTEQLAESEREMRVVLDNVGQGFVTIDGEGRMDSGRSAAMDDWFGEPGETLNVFDLFARIDPEFATRSRFGWDQVREGFMPLDLTLDQMPKDVASGDRVFQVVYKPIGDADAPEQFLVSVEDITAAKASERAQRNHREAMHMLERMLADRQGFIEFFEESTALVGRITSGTDSDDLTVLKRSLHTLKGNSGVFGLESLATVCHELEDMIDEIGAAPPAPALAKLVDRWTSLSEEMEKMTGRERRVIEIAHDEHAELEKAVCARVAPETLLRMVHELKLEPTQRRLDTFGEQARRVAGRLGKEIAVHTEGSELRVDSKYWAGFWSAFVHAVRNAVDHGIETPDARVEAGKPAQGKVSLVTRITDDHELAVEIIDDGAGIDWQRIAAKARERGLPATTKEDLEAALFSDGLSTATQVTDISGRGVGMGALLEATRALGGRIEVDSTLGRGTAMRCVFPVSAMSPELINLMRPALPAAA